MPSIFDLPGRIGAVEALEPAHWPSPRHFREEYAPCRREDRALARDASSSPLPPEDGRPLILLGAAAAMPAYERWRTDEQLSRGAYGAAVLDNVELAKAETRAAGEIKGLRLDAFLRHYRRSSPSAAEGGSGGGATDDAPPSAVLKPAPSACAACFDLYAVASLPSPMRADVLLPPQLNGCGATSSLAEALLWFSAGGTKSVVSFHFPAFSAFLSSHSPCLSPCLSACLSACVTPAAQRLRRHKLSGGGAAVVFGRRDQVRGEHRVGASFLLMFLSCSSIYLSNKSPP
jgi:hypothetical protein